MQTSDLTQMLENIDGFSWLDLPRIVVATYRSGETQLHVGIAFRPSADAGRWIFLHQGFHLYTRADEWTGGRYLGLPLRPGVWAALRLEEEDELEILVRTCEIVRARYAGTGNRQRGLPYAVRYEGGAFDAEGNLQLVSARGRGLTCATFVLALCERINLRLLDLATWPTDRAGDAAWHEAIVKELERDIAKRGNHPEDLDHLEAVRRERPCARYRPEEVVAGVFLREEHPVPFLTAEPLGAQIAASLPYRSK